MNINLLILFTVILIYPINSFSQPPGTEENTDFRKNYRVTLSTNYEYGFNTDIDGGGEFNLNRFSIKGDYKRQLSDRWSLSVDTGYIFYDYDFSGSEGFGGLNPWDKVNKASAGFRIDYKINQKWAVGAGPFIRFSGESGADFGDSVTYGGTLGFFYTPNRDILIGTGLFLSSRIEDDVLVVPGVLFNWQVNDKFRISSLITGVRTELGPSVQLSYDIGNGFSTGLSVGYEFQRFRLDDKGVAPNGVGDVKVLPVWGTIYYDINRMLSVAVYGGAGFFGNMELEDSNGDRILKEDFDTLFFLGAGLKINL